MAKGTFNTPRSLGTVDDIRIESFSVRLDKLETGFEYLVSGNVEEGSDVGGVFQVAETGNVSLKESNLSGADQLALENIMKVLLRAYIANKGYTGVVIT